MQTHKPADCNISLTPIDEGKTMLLMVGGELYTFPMEEFRHAAHRVLCPPELTEGWFPTYTGLMFHPWNPIPDEVCIEDIAHGLSNIGRFSGQTREFYSVAQHSVMVSYIVPAAFALLGLMHDSPEAYCNDMIRDIKRGLPGYRLLEGYIWAAIATKFNLPEHLPPVVKHADNVALATERRDLITKPFQYTWKIDELGYKPLDDVITPWPHKLAEDAFLKRFGELTR